MFIIPGVGSSEDLPVEGDLGRGAVNEWLWVLGKVGQGLEKMFPVIVENKGLSVPRS